MAKLFRVVSRAEEIHRRAIRASISSLGGTYKELTEAAPKFPN